MNPALRNTRADARRAGFLLERQQTFKSDIDTVFGFFADPANLEQITPPWLHFKILNSSTPLVQQGTTLDYRLRLHGLPIRWRSLISDWNPPFHFVDEQLKGPYRSWVHRHTFTETDEGVVVGDHVEYSVHGGALVHALLVRRDLHRIFDFRQRSLATLLPPDSARS